eukprot:5354593-Amphidinium_carterae.1
MWRKLSAWLLGDHCSTQLCGAIGASQYGVYTPSGVARLVHEVMQDAHQHPHCVFMQFDAGNAFGSISRTATLAATAAASQPYHEAVA